MSENKDVSVVKTTIGQRGAVLPLGIVGADGTIKGDIVVRPWRMKEERELAKLRSQNSDSTMSQYVTLILSAMCQKIGPVDFDQEKSLPSRKLTISTMRVPDVLYAYVWLRIQSIGSELKLKQKCPKANCKHEFEFTADLLSTEVVLPKENTDLVSEYTLKTPITIRGQVVKGFKLGIPLWSAIEEMGSGDSPKAGTIQGAVCGFVGVDTPTQLVTSELDELTKFDLENICTIIDDKTFGPIMTIDVQCPKCSNDWKIMIDWNYNNFFELSSL